MASIPRRHVLTGALLGWLGVTAHAQAAWPPVPALSAHRGASALHPEMTAPAFAQALRDGADLLELDVVLRQDGVPVVRHDAALAATEVTGGPPFATTDVATRPEFAQRKTTKTVDGKPQTGWFAEDFTLQELKTLRTRERFPDLAAPSMPVTLLYANRRNLPRRVRAVMDWLAAVVTEHLAGEDAPAPPG